MRAGGRALQGPHAGIAVKCVTMRAVTCQAAGDRGSRGELCPPQSIVMVLRTCEPSFKDRPPCGHHLDACMLLSRNVRRLEEPKCLSSLGRHLKCKYTVSRCTSTGHLRGLAAIGSVAPGAGLSARKHPPTDTRVASGLVGSPRSLLLVFCN